MTTDKIDQEKFSNKRYVLSFTLSTTPKGNTQVLKELTEFIESKNWCTEVISISSYKY